MGGWRPTSSRKIGALSIDRLTASRLLAVSIKSDKHGAHDIAKQAFQTCRMVPRYAVVRGLIEGDPAADVKPGATPGLHL